MAKGTPRYAQGDLIADRFAIEGFAGGGGQGAVYKAVDRANKNMPVAVKILERDDLPRKPKPLERMRNEATALSELDSNRVIRIVATNLDTYGEDDADFDEPPFIAMDFARHGTIDDHDFYRGDSRLALELFEKIVEGVFDIHSKSILHRDLKPANILLVSGQRSPVVGDLGLCRITLEDPDENEKRLTALKERVGPYNFAAPEQTSIPAHFSERGDIYSLGRLLFYLFTGEKDAPSPESGHPKLSSRDNQPGLDLLDEIIAKAAAFSPNDRYKTSEDLLSAVRTAQTKIATSSSQAGRAIKRRPALNEFDQRVLRELASFEDVISTGPKFGELREIMKGYYEPGESVGAVSSYNRMFGRISAIDLTKSLESSLQKFIDNQWVRHERGSYIWLGLDDEESKE